MKILGVIGIGNMGGAIVQGVLDAGFITPDHLVIYDTNPKKTDNILRDHPGVMCVESDIRVAEMSDLVLLAVKPVYLREVLNKIKPALNRKGIISIAAGWTLRMLANELRGMDTTVLRAMPNTPALVGEGMTAICDESDFNQEDFDFAKGIFDSVGRTVVLPERLFDGAIAISGSSPAYIFMLIDAMADGGVREGIPRKLAIEMAAQSVLGSALMVLNTGSHPDELKDAVCSPAGTTIEAVTKLEERGFRAAILDAMDACAEKSRDMSR